MDYIVRVGGTVSIPLRMPDDSVAYDSMEITPPHTEAFPGDDVMKSVDNVFASMDKEPFSRYCTRRVSLVPPFAETDIGALFVFPFDIYIHADFKYSDDFDLGPHAMPIEECIRFRIHSPERISSRTDIDQRMRMGEFLGFNEKARLKLAYVSTPGAYSSGGGPLMTDEAAAINSAAHRLQKLARNRQDKPSFSRVSREGNVIKADVPLWRGRRTG